MSDPLLQVSNLRVEFTLPGGLWRRSRFVAVDGIDLCVAPGETVGLVGESGSGKSTLARAVLRLLRPALGTVSGSIRFRDRDIMAMQGLELRRHRRHMQLVFQDPLASLNPRMTVGDAIAEPLKIFRADLTDAELRSRVDAMLLKVGMEPTAASRYPREFSGGQCQRIGIARALVTDPDLLICDEPVSALDVSIQGQIVNLLCDLRRDRNASMIFISHNLGLVRHVSQRLYVIYRGRIVESGESEALFAAPRHPYTRALMAAMPDGRAGLGGEAAAVGGPADDGAVGSGCAFAPRCPFAAKACGDGIPPLAETGRGHRVACLRAAEI